MSKSQDESIASQVLAASLGGAISASILYPLEVLKTKMQAETSVEEEEEQASDKNKSMVQYAQDLHETHGWSIFLKGMEFSAFQSAMEKALYFFAYTALKQVYFMFGNNTRLDTLSNLVLGCMAEWAHLPVTLPLDCWTTAIQTSEKKETGMQVLMTVLSEKGLKGMYKGVSAYVVLCLKPAIQYTVFEQLRERLLRERRRRHKNPTLSAPEAFGLGMVARAISTILVFPYQRVKVLMQTSGVETTSMLGVLKDIQEEQGWTELFRGLGPELTRGVLSSALMLMIKERIATIVHGMLYHGSS